MFAEKTLGRCHFERSEESAFAFQPDHAIRG
jgi:hypothetical protein